MANDKRIDGDPYGSASAAYASISEPVYFAAPAAELTALLEVFPSCRFLDVGCGTGAVSACVSRIVDSSGLLVAADASPGMLSVCKSRIPTALTVSASLPHLPFASATFDVVAASFVLSHLADPADGVAEMTRVLKPHGLLGVTSWADLPLQTQPGRVWQQHIQARLGVDECEALAKEQLPNENFLADPMALRPLLVRSGLRVQAVLVRSFNIFISTGDFVASRSVSCLAQRLRERLSRTDWDAFLAKTSAELVAQFGNRLEFALRVCFARAVRPSTTPAHN